MLDFLKYMDGMAFAFLILIPGVLLSLVLASHDYSEEGDDYEG